MKALDTSVLLSLLEGAPGAKELLRRLRGVEVATTEANLLELGILAAHGPERLRTARREALNRLRRKITVLPLDAKATDTAIRHLGKGPTGAPPLVTAMLGALESSGCEELLTLDPVAKGKWRGRITRVSIRHPK